MPHDFSQPKEVNTLVRNCFETFFSLSCRAKQPQSPSSHTSLVSVTHRTFHFTSLPHRIQLQSSVKICKSTLAWVLQAARAVNMGLLTLSIMGPLWWCLWKEGQGNWHSNDTFLFMSVEVMNFLGLFEQDRGDSIMVLQMIFMPRADVGDEGLRKENRRENKPLGRFIPYQTNLLNMVSHYNNYNSDICDPLLANTLCWTCLIFW